MTIHIRVMTIRVMANRVMSIRAFVRASETYKAKQVSLNTRLDGVDPHWTNEQEILDEMRRSLEDAIVLPCPWIKRRTLEAVDREIRDAGKTECDYVHGGRVWVELPAQRRNEFQNMGF